MEPDPTREWYYEEDGERLGPISERRLLEWKESGQLEEASLVWTSGMPDWAPLAEARAGKVTPSPPTLPSPGPGDEETEEENDPADPMVECAFSGVKRPRSAMLPFGEVWVAPEHRQEFVQQLAESGKAHEVPLEGVPFPANLQFEPVFGQSLRIFGAQWKEIVIFSLCVWGPVYLLLEGLVSLVYSSGPTVDSLELDSNWYLFEIWVPTSLNIGSELLVGAFAAAAIFQMSFERWSGRGQWETAQFFGNRIVRFGRVLLTRLVLFVVLGLAAGAPAAIFFFAGGLGGIMFGFVLIIVLVALFMTRLTSSEPLSLLIGRGGSAAIAVSWRLTRGRFWRVFGYRLLVLLPVSIIAGVVGALLEIPQPFFQHFVVRAAVSTVVALPAAFVYVFEMVLAIHLFENGEVSSRQEVAEEEAAAPSE